MDVFHPPQKRESRLGGKERASTIRMKVNRFSREVRLKNNLTVKEPEVKVEKKEKDKKDKKKNKSRSSSSSSSSSSDSDKKKKKKKSKK